MTKIPFFGLSRQYRNLKNELLEATDNALKHGELMNGPYTTLFEEWLAKRTGVNYAVTVHSGTQALEIIAKFHMEPYKDILDPVVKIPNITYVATMNAFLNAGWKIELIDTDKNGLLKDSDDEEDYAYAICLVGLYGANPTLTKHYNANIIDGAQHWLVADSVYDGMAISFDPTKNLPASGNGGAIVTNDEYLYEYALNYRNNGKYFEHETAGSNTRMSEQECAQILVRTKYIDKWQWRRKEIRHYYLDEFKGLPFHCLSRDYIVHSDQKFVIYTDNRKELRYYLDENGIETKIHYEKALSELPISRNITKPDILSTSIMLTRGLLSLPMYPELTDTEVEYIAKTVKSFFTC